MTNAYRALKDKQQKEVNEFPFIFAFSQAQLEKGMKEKGLDPSETDKLGSMGVGCFYLKKDKDKLKEMMSRQEKEMKDAIDADETGEGFIYDMFLFELANHEYGYTYDLEPTLDALGLTLKEVSANPKIRLGLEKARKAVLAG